VSYGPDLTVYAGGRARNPDDEADLLGMLGLLPTPTAEGQR